jgi:capsid protein
MVILEKAIEAISPDWAARRAVARHDLGKIRAWSPGWGGGYAGGSTSRKRKSAAYARSFPGTEESVAGYGAVVAALEAMDLYRNNPLARALVEITRRYCGQSRPRAATAAHVLPARRAIAEEWDRAATDYFDGYWWNRSDAQRRSGVTLGTLQEWYVTIQFLQGDIAYVWTGDGLVTVEGLQIQTPSKLASDPNVRNGFRFNGQGRATHMYYLDYSGGGFDSENYNRVSMDSVIFCPWYWRPASIRSVPRLHGVIDTLRDHDEIHDNTLLKIKQEAALLSIERVGSRKAAPGSKFTNSDGTETTLEQADYGMRFKTTGKPGEDFTFANGQSPNAQYVPAMEYTGKLISTGVGIPFNALMSLYDGSWSSNKAVQTALKKFVMEIWTLRRDTFCQRFYNLAISQGIAQGHLDPAPVNDRGYSLFGKAEWSKPYFPQQDQQKEEAGRSAAFQNVTQSLDDFADEQGTTAAALLDAHKRNMKQLKADAVELGLPLEIYCAGLLAASSSVSGSTGQAIAKAGGANE